MATLGLALLFDSLSAHDLRTLFWVILRLGFMDKVRTCVPQETYETNVLRWKVACGAEMGCISQDARNEGLK